MKPCSLRTVVGLAALSFAGLSRAAVLMDFDVTGWSGSGNWTDGVAGEQLTIGAGVPVKATDIVSFPGQVMHYASFNGASGFVSDASSLMAGLKEFTISAVIRVGGNPGNGSGNATNGWTFNPITAFELVNPNQGEFQFGFPSGNGLGGAVGLDGDHSIIGSAVAANTWATVAFTLDQDPLNSGTLTQFAISVYINGVLSAASAPFNYGAGTGAAIRDSPFGIGYNVINNLDRRYLTGDIAHVRYDNAVLSPAQLTADAANFLGTLTPVPEPSTGLLAIAGLAAGTLRRRRRQPQIATTAGELPGSDALHASSAGRADRWHALCNV